MADHHIWVHGSGGTATPARSNPVSPQYQQKTATAATQPDLKQKRESSHSMSGLKATALVLGTAMKINQYVGELTENTLNAKRTQTGLTFAGIAAGMVANPVAGSIALVAYVGNASISYGIKNYKENLSANYLRQLSGGTTNRR